MSTINPHCIGDAHAVGWADDGSVGYLCPCDPKATPGHPTGTLSQEDRYQEPCEHCGHMLRLVWDVQIVDMEPGDDPQKQAGKADLSTGRER